MIESLNNYTLTILCSSVIIQIVQMILPNGNSKKYVLFVCGLIMMIVIINPIVSIFNKDIDVSNLLEKNKKIQIEFENEEYEKYYQNVILENYKSNIKYGIINRLEDMGYKVEKIEIEYDKVTNEPIFLKLTISSNSGEIQSVRVEVMAIGQHINNNLTSSMYDNIKKMLKDDYGISNVQINEE